MTTEYTGLLITNDDKNVVSSMREDPKPSRKTRLIALVALMAVVAGVFVLRSPWIDEEDPQAVASTSFLLGKSKKSKKKKKKKQKQQTVITCDDLLGGGDAGGVYHRACMVTADRNGWVDMYTLMQSGAPENAAKYYSVAMDSILFGNETYLDYGTYEHSEVHTATAGDNCHGYASYSSRVGFNGTWSLHHEVRTWNGPSSSNYMESSGDISCWWTRLDGKTCDKWRKEIEDVYGDVGIEVDSDKHVC